MPKPFKIHIDQAIIDNLKYRLAQTRWITEIDQAGWQYGTDLHYLQALCTYWQNNFDWRKTEARLNEWAHCITTINDIDIHFIHEKGKGTTSVPLLLIHGFPDSFVRFLKIIPLLTAADDEGFSFDLVIPSIPGYGFSGIPKKPGMSPQQVASIFEELMTNVLGYKRYYIHGGDWGSTIAEQIAFRYPHHITGIHFTDIPWHHLLAIPPGDLSEAEKKYMEAGKKWQMTEGGYAIIQSTKPQALGYGFNDSPAGLAAWIIQFFHDWSDCQDNLENCFTKDELLTNITIYWATQTINSAMRIYYEAMRHLPENALQKIAVPAGVAIFTKDTITAPRDFAERIYNVQQWTNMPRGGHFAAMEQPDLLAEDIRSFIKMVKAH
jgi:pimeloyl-ACP methyl ester carboxylesterase